MRIEDDGGRVSALDLHLAGRVQWPKFVTDFLLSYLENHPPRSVLDVTADVEGMLPALVRRFSPDKAAGLTNAPRLYAALEDEKSESIVEWITGNPLESLQQHDGTFDLVVGMPPWGTPPSRITFSSPRGPVVVNDDGGSLLMLSGLLTLGSEGVAFFVMPPSFLFRRKSNSVRSRLGDFGIHIDAILSLPAGTFASTTNSAGLLVVARKVASGKVFVAELNANVSWQKALEQNLKLKREGRVVQLGALVDSDSFTSFERFLADNEVTTLGRKLGTQPTPLTEITIEINQIRSGTDFSDKPNSVYIPTIGRSPAVASLTELRLKPHNYLQVVLKPNCALASHVADFFNSRLGLLIRAGLESGSFIRHLTKGAIADARIYLPALPLQGEAVRVKTTIADIATQLESLRRELSENPLHAKEIEKSLKRLGREETLDDWVESLPFPLASILRFYLAELNSERKCQHLLHFFEALSEFTSTLILSAFASDMAFYSEKCEEWLDKDEHYKNAFRLPSFGTWNILGTRLAKAVRRMLSNEAERKKCLDLFESDEPFVSALSEKSLFQLLEEVKTYRNEWLGHGGIASNDEWFKRRTLLEEKLAALRNIMRDLYSDTLFILPGSNRYDEGIYHYTVKVLRGSGQIFNKIQLDTLLPMSSGHVHAVYTGHLKPLKLLPFVRILESPGAEQNACYFYNRFDGAQARYVSYHFRPEGEIDRTDQGIESALALLIPGIASSHPKHA